MFVKSLTLLLFPYIFGIIFILFTFTELSSAVLLELSKVCRSIQLGEETNPNSSSQGYEVSNVRSKWGHVVSR